MAKGIVLSLQGGMAVGKTTAACYLRQHAPYVHVVLEDHAGVVEEVRRRGLDKNRYEDYLEIQRLYLRTEVRRWQEASAYPCSVMDYGAEEIEFYTLFYPQTIGKQWDVEQPLKQELAAVRACMPDRILFLDASDETLRRRRKNDMARSRGFFEHSLTYLLPLKRKWFLGRLDVDVLHVDTLTAEQTGEKVKEWVDFWLTKQAERIP